MRRGWVLPYSRMTFRLRVTLVSTPDLPKLPGVCPQGKGWFEVEWKEETIGESSSSRVGKWCVLHDP